MEGSDRNRRLYLLDIGGQLKEEALMVKRELEGHTPETPEWRMWRGRLWACRDVIDCLQTNACLREIPLEELV